MGVHAKVSVDAGSFLLADAFDSLKEIRAEFVNVVPFDAALPPYLSIRHAAAKCVKSALEGDSDVSLVKELVDRDADVLAKLGWAPTESAVVDALSETDAVCVAGAAEDALWTLHLVFPSHAAVAQWYNSCRSHDEDVSLRSMNSSNQSLQAELPHRSRLTDAQLETLETALRAGYFHVPRDVELGTIADELDISDTAASQRLRRGLERLLEDTLAPDRNL